MSDDIGRATRVYFLHYNRFKNTQIHVTMDLTIGHRKSLRNIDEAYFRALAKSFGSYNYDYVGGVMIE